MPEKVIIVDDQDNIIGSKERDLAIISSTYRTSALWIVNSKNEILIAQRSLNKKNGAGKWGPASAGTVENNESYRDNIVKETKEEIGIDLNKYPFKKIEKVKINKKHKYFCQWYLLKKDIDISKIKIQEDEVEQVSWIDKKDLENELKLTTNKYIGSMQEHFKFLKKY